MNSDLNIKCPKCGEYFDLDETLAGPMVKRVKEEKDKEIKGIREEYDSKLKIQGERESMLVQKEMALAEREESINSQVNAALAAEKTKLLEKERARLREEFAVEISAGEQKQKQLLEKLTETQQSEQRLLAEAARIQEREKELQLEIAREVNQAKRKMEAESKKEIESFAEAKNAEWEEQLKTLKKTFEEKSAVDNLRAEAVRAAEKIRLQDTEEALRQAQANELALRQEKDKIDLRAKQLDLEVAQKIDAGRQAIHEKAQAEVAESHRLQMAEQEKKTEKLKEELAEALRKSEQGSQQLQGEVLEQDFEDILQRMFPRDVIIPVKPGTKGGDILQMVEGEMGRPVGTIFWEVKRTQSFSNEFIHKAKKDSADAKADATIIVSQALPKDVQSLGLVEGVWVTNSKFAVVIGTALRLGIIRTAEANQRQLGKETKAERLYEYMHGPEFRGVLEGIALPFRAMSEELDREKRTTLTRWKRQEKRIADVLENVAALQGDLQAIVGMEILELPGFETISDDEE